MNATATAITVYETTDYGLFKTVKENRNVSDKRIRKITESMKKHGFRYQPILCNSKMEIIDGQGRLQACKSLGIPALFVIDPKATMEVCREMNSAMTNWTLDDYIVSYAAEGRKEYEQLFDLLATYTPAGIPSGLVIMIATGTMKNPGESIRGGEFKFSIPFAVVKTRLNFISQVMAAVPAEQVSRAVFQKALLRVFYIPGVDLNLLLRKIKANPLEIRPAARYDLYLEMLGAIYNKRLSEDKRIDFISEYAKAIRQGTAGLKGRAVRIGKVCLANRFASAVKRGL